MPPSAEALVGARYDAAAPHGHVESYFLKANDPRRRRAIWLRATIFASDRHPEVALAEAWAIAFDGDTGQHVAVKTQVPFANASFAKDRLRAEVDGCVLAPGVARGRVETAGRSVAWDLTFDTSGAALVHFPKTFLYEGPFPRSKLVSPLPDIRVSGHVEVNLGGGAERWEVAQWPGLLGHNWGRTNAFLYAWGHVNAWEGDEEVVLEGVSARVKVGPLTTPITTLVCIRHRGVRYDLNALSDIARNTGAITPRRWTFRGKNELVAVEGELWGETDDFVGLYYPNPDGSMCHCLNTKLARAEVKLTTRGRAPITLRSRAAALEIGTRDPLHGVRMYV